MSTPQFSLLVYLDKDRGVLVDFINDLQAFFGKFPIPLEVIFAVEKGATCDISSTTQIQFKVIRNSKHRGRAQSLLRALNEAQAPYICTVPIELSTPLGDIFKLLQNIVGEEKIAAALGDRYKKKELSFAKVTTPRARIENFFRGILREKNPHSVSDPLCEIFAIKKQAWLILRDQMETVRGWYLAPTLHRALQLTQTSYVEVPIFDSGVSSESYTPWKQKLRLFSLSLKK